MKGMHYQDFRDNLDSPTTYIDPLEDGARCTRDIPYLKELGVNTLFIGFVRHESVHTTCLSKFQDAGIYVLVNLESPSAALASTETWDHAMYQRYTRIINSLAKFSNVLGFWILGVPQAQPLLRAAVRDIKQYMRDTGHRAIPIGAWTPAPSVFYLTDYLTCGEDSTALDFLLYGLAYDRICPQFVPRMREDLDALISIRPSVPLFVMANACNVSVLVDSNILLSTYSDNYTAIHSGGCLFPYFDNYGINGFRTGK
jgi:hypothetical protein